MNRWMMVALTLGVLGLIVVCCLFSSPAAEAAVGTPLTMAEQHTARGGACSGAVDTDCMETKVVCIQEKVWCQSNADCAPYQGKMVCRDDNGKDHACVDVYFWGLKCVYDPDHVCHPQYEYTGACEYAVSRCDLQTSHRGDCTVGWKPRTMRQCHN